MPEIRNWRWASDSSRVVWLLCSHTVHRFGKQKKGTPFFSTRKRGIMKSFGSFPFLQIISNLIFTWVLSHANWFTLTRSKSGELSGELLKSVLISYCEIEGCEKGYHHLTPTAWQPSVIKTLYTLCVEGFSFSKLSKICTYTQSRDLTMRAKIGHLNWR